VPGLAIALWALALVFVFSMRIVLHRRATGSTGILRPGHRPFSVAWTAELAFEGSTVLMAAGAIIEAAGGPETIGPLDSEPLQIVAAVVAIAGMAGIIAAQTAMGTEWRIGVADDQGTKLVADGPFRWVRNPIYTGMLIGFGGIVLTAASPIALAGFAIFVLGIELQVRKVEEPYLRQAHGDRYMAYARRVGRFAPGIGRLAP
jgi:protein-S-isoprenylcysteine O-methyltransferase Ste14